MTTAMTGNVDIAVRTQVDYFGAGRYDLAGQMVTPDYVDHEAPPGTPPGPEGANMVLRWLRGAFADLSYEICDAFGDGDRVAARLITTGTHTRVMLSRIFCRNSQPVMPPSWRSRVIRLSVCRGAISSASSALAARRTVNPSASSNRRTRSAA